MTTATRDQRTKLMVHYPAGNAADPRELQAFLDAVIAAVGPSVIIGGTAASSTLTLKSTTGVGTTDAIIFVVGNNGATEALRILSAGTVSVGHTADLALAGANTIVQIVSNDSTKWVQTESLFSANAAAPGLAFAKSRNATKGSHTVVQSGDGFGNILFYGSDGTNFVAGAGINASCDGTPGTNDMPGRLVLSTTADGASSVTERARIDNKGNVVINTAAIATSATDGFLYIPSSAGAPTGTPTSYSGRVPIEVNTSQNGLHWYSGSAWRGEAFIETGTVTNAATKNFTVPSGYDELVVTLINWLPATDNVALFMRFSQSSSFLSGVADYGWSYIRNAAEQVDDSDSEITMADGWGNAAGEYGTFVVRILRPSAASFRKTATWSGGYQNTAGNFKNDHGYGSLIANTNAIDGFQFLFSSGNISEGYYAVRAYKY